MKIVSIANSLEGTKAALIQLYKDNAITFNNCDNALSKKSKYNELSNQLKQINSINDLLARYQSMFDYVFLDKINSI